MRLSFRSLLLSFGAFALIQLAVAQNKKIPQRISSEKDYVQVLPSPGEIVNSIHLLGRNVDFEWSKYVDYEIKTSYIGQNSKALNLGVRSVDAFIAIYDNDLQNFGKMNETIFSLAKDLRIQLIKEEDENKLKKLATQDKWDELTAELSELHVSLMEEVRNTSQESIFVFTGLGGFLEGYRVISEFLLDHPDISVKILKRAKIANFYIEYLHNLEKKDAFVLDVEQNLKKLKAIAEKKNIEKKDVESFNMICKNLTAKIIKG